MAAENFKVKKGLEVGTAITATSSGVNVTGIVTATQFVGDGSGLTGVTGSGSGVVVKDEGSAVGTAGTINFVGSGVAASLSLGTATITVNAGGLDNVVEDTTPQLGGNIDLNGKFVNGTGGANITGVVTATTLKGNGDFVDIDVDGRADLDDLVVAGVSTFGNNINASGTSRFEIASMENGVLDGEISHNGDATTKIKFPSNKNISFDTDGTTRLNIDNSGVTVTGIATATSFSGSGIGLTSLNADNLGSGEIPNGRFPATLPAASGVNLTALNASEITSGTLPIARIADNAVTFAKMQDVGTGVLIGRNDGGSGDMETLSASEVRTLLNVADGATAGITTAASNVQVTWSVGANGASAYRFTGPGNDGSDDNPDLYLIRGQKYRFINNSGGSHPFQIRSSAGGSAYSTGVTNNGASSGNIDFNVQHDAPTRLYYQCTAHGGMVGNIYITGGASWQTSDVNTSTTEKIFTNLNVGMGN